MTAEVVIAARGGPEAKSRCRGRLGAADRERLAEAMLADMLQALAGCRRVRRVYVTTPTPALARRAARDGAVVILEQQRDLNAAFDDARRRIAEVDPSRTVALLPGDLPLLDPAELDAAVAMGTDGAVVLVPATADGGTGAIVMRAGTALPLAFGPDSFARHLAAARRLGLEARIFHAPSLGFDLDRPDDVERMLSLPRGGRTGALLRGAALIPGAAA